MTNWAARIEEVINSIAQQADGRGDYARANRRAIQRTLEGLAVHSNRKSEGAGYRIVVNMSSAHIPSFCDGSAYKNAYELEREGRRVGNPSEVSDKRIIVDAALKVVTGCDPESLYFAAVELNGSGIGFYGDYCLVLREDDENRHLTVLDRNSYDLLREPLLGKIDAESDTTTARAEKARELSGRFGEDLAIIAAIKVLESRPSTGRLLSTAMISTGVLEDEDYIEVLRTKSFISEDVVEVRLSANDVAVDERIRSRGVSGLPPSHAEFLWRRRRRVAESRLAEKPTAMRVVTTAGRSRG
jgi:hypothetical protein